MNILTRTQDHDVEVFKTLDAIVNAAALDDILHHRILRNQQRPQDTQALEDFLEAVSHIGTSYGHSFLQVRTEQLACALYQLLSVMRKTCGPLRQERNKLGTDPGASPASNAARIELSKTIDSAWDAYKDYREAIKDKLKM
jgi:uncharacterized protein YigA (DUF484 family)